jgi:L-alanine-DL-glutamate epimerase-like enolase superfamily enzyme
MAGVHNKKMIKQIEVVNGSIPLTKTTPEQLWLAEWSNQVFVKAQTDEGLTGWGEVLPAGGNLRDPYVALINRLKASMIGKDESEYRSLWNMMRKITFSGGYGITTGAISGIDIALWDILGKKANLPVCKILGSSPSQVKRYVSLSRYGKLEDLKELFKNLLGEGYEAIKLHQSSADTLEAVRLVRKEFGNDFELMVDLNCGFSYSKARDFMINVQRYELKWVEEPLWPPDDFELLAELNKLGPVAAGENFFSIYEFKRLLEMGALTYYQPDVAKIGGITPMVELLHLLKVYQANIAFHNRPHNGWVGITASAQVASAAKEVNCIIETPPSGIPSQYFTLYPSVTKNEVKVNGPGLGISLLEPVPESADSKLLTFHDI